MEQIWPYWRKRITKVDFGVSNAHSRPSVPLHLLLANLEVELSASLQHHVSLCATVPSAMMTID